MSTPAISYTVREFVRTLLLDATTGFNALIQQTGATYGVTPFVLSTGSTPPTLFLGRYDYPSLKLAMGDNLPFPFAVLSTAKSDQMGSQNMQVTPSTFSGQIVASIDFYVLYPSASLPPDGESMFHAVEDALVGAFNTPASYGLVPAGVVYNNQSLTEQANMEFIPQTGWVQLIPCALMFELVV